MFVAQGLIGPNVLWRTAVFLPILIVGEMVGNRGFVRAESESFKKVTQLVFIALSAILCLRALWPNFSGRP